MAHVLVTGGAGFIGSHLVEALLRRGDRVRVFDNFSTGRYENVKHLHNDIELIEGDLRDFDAVRRAVASVEVVFHQAALASVQRSVDDPMTTNAVNVTGTLHVLVAARDAGVRRVVFASSSSVYGDTPTLPKVETQCCSRSPRMRCRNWQANSTVWRSASCMVCHPLHCATSRLWSATGPALRICRRDPAFH